MCARMTALRRQGCSIILSECLPKAQTVTSQQRIVNAYLDLDLASGFAAVRVSAANPDAKCRPVMPRQLSDSIDSPLLACHSGFGA